MSDFESGRIEGLREASRICSRIATEAKEKQEWGEHNGAWDCQLTIDGASGDLQSAFAPLIEELKRERGGL